MPYLDRLSFNLKLFFIEDICSACSPMQMKVFYKNVLILQINDSNFPTLKVA